jgi:hypothetical protein
MMGFGTVDFTMIICTTISSFMPISLNYIGNRQHTEFVEATEQAHELLQSPDFITLIERRGETPFDDSVPEDLPVAQVAGYFRNETFTLSVDDYADERGRTNVGGRFVSRFPNTIWLNTLAILRREACEFASVLIHEAVHAKSRRISSRTDGKVEFTHIPPNEREGNQETAPYWIQEEAGDSLCGQHLNPEKRLLIETVEDSTFRQVQE